MPGTTGAGDVEQALGVGVDHLFPVFGVVLVELAEAAAEAGVVDKDVDDLPLGWEAACLAEEGVDGSPFGDVQGLTVNGLGARSEEIGFEGLQLVEAAGAEKELGTGVGERPGGGLADAGAGAGDEGLLCRTRRRRI